MIGLPIEEKKRRVHVFRHPEALKKGWEQWYLIAGCVHLDNPKCLQDLYKADLEEAKRRNAGVFLFGDTFCAMEGKYDKRHAKGSVREELMVNNYFDALVKYHVDFHKPYAGNLSLITEGNHETGILKRHETNLTERLVSGIKLMNPNANVHHGAYHGWVVFEFGSEGDSKKSIRLNYHHGYGGGGPVTKGVIRTNRRGVMLPDADIVVGAHVHESWVVELRRERINKAFGVNLDTQWHLQTPTYKEEYLHDAGWHIERGAPPKPIGGYWLRFYYHGKKIYFSFERTKSAF